MSQRVIDVTLTVLSDVDVLVFGLDDKKQYAYGRLCSVLDSMITTEITLTISLLCSAASVLLGLLRLILCCLNRRRAPAAGLKRTDPLPGRGRPYSEIWRCNKK